MTKKSRRELSPDRKRAVAHALADKMQPLIDAVTWSALVDSIDNLGPKERYYLLSRVRWTLIDEVTAENLLEP